MAQDTLDNFDWTISEEFPEENAGPPSGPLLDLPVETPNAAPARGALSRRVVALTLSLIPVLILIPWLAARWAEQRTRETLEHLALQAAPAPMPLVGVAPISEQSAPTLLAPGACQGV